MEERLNFINKYSWKALLGRQSKNLIEKENIYFWDVGNKHHFCTNKTLDISDLKDLEYPINFHYMSEDNVKFLKKNAKVSTSKHSSIYYDLSKFSLNGGNYKSVRQSINKASKYNLKIQDHFNEMADVKLFINEWSTILAQKYFRDFSGKSLYFYQQNFHKDCLNIFLYDNEKLVSFGSLSPSNDGYSSYVNGKAHCHNYKGLSEYTDFLLYQKAIEKGIKYVNLGQAKGGLLYYKNKFPGSNIITHYDGQIEGLK